ncbi:MULTISPECIES: ABC transporter permease [unclassified Ruminococcus]|uniref:ABC transporter permease n=1 Tax=unclassified Ruminococcus TaxID=2608920 RepID=UPI00210E1630|nr:MULTISPECIES: ABC transporter permease [unclassified Ruminococcus]MCQ4022747.1 ABC transporter permease subunit [Ruminococcus sp. zg-924]MCQ4114987.1 ABC transporter permease subunit [Ruminococcus sp. zg-921]
MRIKAFASRNIKELIRDPLSYIFCLGFPLIMLLVMSVIGQSIPENEGTAIFNVQNQSAGTAVFGLAFVMLFAALLISKDRASALLCRLFASPMRSVDFILGYTLPLIIIAAAQLAVNVISSVIIGAAVGESFNFLNLLMSLAVHIPTIFLFIGLGIIFGTLFNEKSSPGISSIIVSLAPMLGGVWMPIDAMGGVILTIAKIFPFYHAVKASRTVLAGSSEGVAASILILCAWAAVIFILSIFVFKAKMRSEKK